jgi:hypothetical protein
LLSGKGAKTQIGLSLGAGAVAGDEVAEVIGTTGIAALVHHAVKAAGGERRELLECGKDKGR